MPVVRLRLLPSSPRVDRILRLLCELVEGGTGTGTGGVPSTAAPKAGGGTGSAGRGGSSEGGVDVDVGGGGVGVALALVDGGTVCCVVAFKLTFLLCQRPCIDLLRAFGPWLTRDISMGCCGEPYDAAASSMPQDKAEYVENDAVQFCLLS